MSVLPTRIVRLQNRNTPERTLLRDLRHVARLTGSRLVTGAVYQQHGAFGISTLISRFGSWNATLAAAGLGVTRRWRVPNAELMQNLADVWRRLGHQPAFAELTKGNGVSKFAGDTYRSRFGSWRNALGVFETFVRTGSLGAVDLPSRPKAGPRTSRNVGFRLRATVLIRDNCLCRMCGASPASDPRVRLHVDHIVPWSRGGETVLSNLQTLCATCNLGKGDTLHRQVSKRASLRYRAARHQRRGSRRRNKRKKRCPRPMRPIASSSS